MLPFISGLAIKTGQRMPMVLVECVGVTVYAGIEGNWVEEDENKERQIALLSYHDWHNMKIVKEQNVPWTTRRAQMLITNIWFRQRDVDIRRRLQIGPSVILEVTGETTPCELMDKFVPGLREALTPNFRGGVTTRVLEGGVVSMNDPVLWIS